MRSTDEASPPVPDQQRVCARSVHGQRPRPGASASERHAGADRAPGSEHQPSVHRAARPGRQRDRRRGQGGGDLPDAAHLGADAAHQRHGLQPAGRGLPQGFAGAAAEPGRLPQP